MRVVVIRYAYSAYLSWVAVAAVEVAEPSHCPLPWGAGVEAVVVASP